MRGFVEKRILCVPEQDLKISVMNTLRAKSEQQSLVEFLLENSAHLLAPRHESMSPCADMPVVIDHFACLYYAGNNSRGLPDRNTS